MLQIGNLNNIRITSNEVWIKCQFGGFFMQGVKLNGSFTPVRTLARVYSTYYNQLRPLVRLYPVF